MIHPKLLASQELALHRVNVQQQNFVSRLARADGSVNSINSASNSNASGSVFPRAVSARSELTSPLTPGGAGSAVPAFPPKESGTSPLGPLTGGGANSTAPASIARPGIRPRPEWSTALEDVDPFVLPDHQLHGSVPATRRRVTVQYIADQYDRQWLAQRTMMTATMAAMTKGKTGSIDAPAAPPSPTLSSSRHDITLSLFEDLITAFEVESYRNPEIPVQRQPVSSFDGVIATGADAAVVEEVRQYWLGKQQALGGNVPCIPSLRMNVREDNQSTLCHSDILQYCPLPFSHRDWSIAVVQRRVPWGCEKTTVEAEATVEDSLGAESIGRKRKRCGTVNATTSNEGGTEAGEEEMKEDEEEAEEKEWQTLLTSALKISQVVWEREEWKLAHTHLAIYELALLRRWAMLGREAVDGAPTHSSAPAPWANDEELQEEWVGDDDATEEFHDGVGGEAMATALESVMAISRRFW
ncbi:hypothetical protein DQ04_02291070 [Trypanosoma grayi]|uniref:hypothetical protein n=1 Tax=Trypanosoma grayi TaxID=71804 RepID=UPI0004F41E3D|nr:hypothetical protein DQ04_02291070 [Trypanosoma grayi]KEG11777.1 hypothetical protein DQ04_02291070 [Trypanosoma grayi]